MHRNRQDCSSHDLEVAPTSDTLPEVENLLAADVVLLPLEDRSQALTAVPFHSRDGARLVGTSDLVCTQGDNPLPAGW
jgi:hypothetical protein